MSLTPNEIRQIKDKVLYSEIDTSFTKYMEGVTNTASICNQLLRGELAVPTEENKDAIPFNGDIVKNLSESTDLHFLEVQSSIDIKKTTVENWQQSNDNVKNDIKNNVSEVLPELKAIHGRLRGRIQKIQALYNNVKSINKGFNELATNNTDLTVTQEEWENELGKDITKELITKNCLQIKNNSRYASSGKTGDPTKDRYGVYENFSKGPKEAKQLNKTMKSDIEKLTKEIDEFKKKWQKDADVFTKVTNVLQEELSKRDQKLHEFDIEMDGNEDSDDEYEEDDERRDNNEDERSQRQSYDDNNENGDESSSIAEDGEDETEGNGDNQEEENEKLSNIPANVENEDEDVDMNEGEPQQQSDAFESQTTSVEPVLNQESDRANDASQDYELTSDVPSESN